MAKKKRRGEREVERKRAEFLASQRRLTRRRAIVGVLGLVPLLGFVACGTGTPLDVLCAIPRDWWLLIWVALFGTFLGITIRLVLDRRRFERGAQGGRSG